MKSSRWLWIAVAILVIWLVLTWFLGEWIGLKPPALYYLRAGLWIIGIAGFVGYWLLRPKPESDSNQAPDAPEIEIDYNFAEARKRLEAARGIKQLGSLPVVFVIGNAGTAKTSVIAKSGLEPQLLAGHAHEDYVVAPTRTVNLWFARNILFVDPAGSIVSDAATRKKLFQKFLPVRLNAIFATKSPPSRAVVFTVSCEMFLQAGGAEVLTAKARQFHSILGELSQELGSGFPVYVLFTKADKIAYFRDFVENFTEAEASEIFGVTLPLHGGEREGVYAEQQTRRLTEAFQQLYYSLCDKRPVYLAREYDSARLPNIYEFAREFAKIRPLLVQFLIDLGRPAQLGVSPFLRGFYFTGVRPVAVTDLAPAAVHAPLASGQLQGAGATGIFNPRSSSASAPDLPREVGTRKVPQWVFLSHLFSEVILSDRPATTITQSNVKINFARRLILVAGSALALFVALWWIISYTNNRGLIQEAAQAEQEASSTGLSAGQLASFKSLQRLTRLKNTLARIDDYNKNGAPLSYDLFLYEGWSIRAPIRTAYYALFRKLLLAPTQETLVSICAKPEVYGNNYRYVYDSLKAYLITTNRPEKTSADFLTPVLMFRWQQNQQATTMQQNLARENFDFYAGDLVNENPYPAHTRPDANAVTIAREYLNKFGQQETIYEAMLDDAGKGRKSIVFNDDYPGSQETIRNRFVVPAAFTKNGFDKFMKQSQHPETYFSGEDWVLGEKLAPQDQSLALKQFLINRYDQDFVKTWQAYLNATSMVGYQSVPDAANKLGKMSSPPFPILQLLCVASENTNEKEISQAFQPVQFVTLPGCAQKLVGGGNSAYMNALIALKSALQTVGPIANADPNNVTAANNAATQAETAVDQVALNFANDPQDPKSNVVSKTTQILRDPIARVQPLLKGAGAGPINQAAGGMCAQIAPMLGKYPFSPKSKEDATLDEVNQFLKPQDGQLWKLYNGSLKQLLVPGPNGDYIAASGQQLSVTPAFLRFFNRAMRMSDALFHGEAQPDLKFSVQALPVPGLDHVALLIDGVSLSADVQRTAATQTFSWPGTSPGFDISVKFSGGSEFNMVSKPGVWAIWHVIDAAENPQYVKGQYQIELTSRTQLGIQTISGHPAVVKFLINSQSSQVFRPGYFAGLACVSKAVQ